MKRCIKLKSSHKRNESLAYGRVFSVFKKILKVFEEGEDVFPHSNGTWSIKINKWEDAYKVTPEQYAEQLKSLDDTGNFGISQMNEAVESTWRERGLIAGDGLLSKNAKERKK